MLLRAESMQTQVQSWHTVNVIGCSEIQLSIPLSLECPIAFSYASDTSKGNETRHSIAQLILPEILLL